MAKRSQADLETIAKLLGRVIPVVFVAAAIVTCLVVDLGTALLVLAFGTLLGIITVLWASVRALTGDAPITVEDALAISAPTAAEEQKRAVLRALKDLDYERSVGKIAEGDYQELLHRYRTEAKRLLRSLDEELRPLRERAEAYVAKELGGKTASKRNDAAEPSARTAPKAEEPKTSAPTASPCPSCHTANDTDAVFCKKCGAKLAGSVLEKQDATA